MSDLEIRLRERIFSSEPTLENANLLIAAYQRGSELLAHDWNSIRESINTELRAYNFNDMHILSYDLTNLCPEDCEDRHIATMNWLEAVASFVNTNQFNWEYILYIGLLYQSEIDIKSFARVRWSQTSAAQEALGPGAVEGSLLPTPPELIPIIQQALELGAWYISFNTG